MNKDKPLVSYIVLTYNQESYVEEALASALSQTYENIQFVFSDDASVDDTFRIINRVANSSERDVLVNKNDVNMGIASHINKCMDLAEGDIIVLAAGDDISLHNRVDKSVDYFVKNEDLVIVSFNDYQILNGEKLENQVYDLKSDVCVNLKDYVGFGFPFFSGASRAIKKNLFSVYGDLHDNCPTEDTPYILRALMMGQGLVSSDPGIYYRKHQNNLSSHKNLVRMNFGALRDQYIQDLGRAKEDGLVTDKDADLVKEWIYYSYSIRELLKEPRGGVKVLKSFRVFCASSLFRRKVAEKISGMFF